MKFDYIYTLLQNSRKIDDFLDRIGKVDHVYLLICT